MCNYKKFRDEYLNYVNYFMNTHPKKNIPIRLSKTPTDFGQYGYATSLGRVWERDLLETILKISVSSAVAKLIF